MSRSEGMIELMGAAPVAAGASFLLRIRRPHRGEEETIELSGTTVSIGRAEANNIHVADRQLSRFHARIALENGVWAVTDLSSKNGTTVNGKPIDRAVLRHGDIVQAGETVLVFEREASAPPPAPAAAGSGASGVPEESLDALLAFGELVACAESELGVLDDLVARLRDVIRADRCVIYLVEEGQSRPLMQYASEDTVTGDIDVNAPDPAVDVAMAAERPALESLDGDIARHLLIVPLHARYRKTGVMVLERGDLAGPFGEGELRLGSVAACLVTSFLRSVI